MANRCGRVAIVVGFSAAAALLSGCGGTTVEGNPRGDGSPPITSTASAPTSTARSSAPTTTSTTTTSSSSSSKTTATTTTAAPAVDPSTYAGSVSGSYFFTSPSGKFNCAIIGGGAQPSAGCQGDLPADAPKVDGSGAPGKAVFPNSIEVAGGEPGRFVSLGDPKYTDLDGPARELPYGAPLSANGFTCAVDESTGVTCTDSSRHGFTVSNNAFRVF
ncbi:hypothetical protein ACNHUS_18155 [Actinomycetes bacterium M1A6_2h]